MEYTRHKQKQLNARVEKQNKLMGIEVEKPIQTVIIHQPISTRITTLPPPISNQEIKTKSSVLRLSLIHTKSDSGAPTTSVPLIPIKNTNIVHDIMFPVLRSERVIDLTSTMKKNDTTFWSSNITLFPMQASTYLVNIRWINYSYFPDGSKKHIPQQWKSLNSRFLLDIDTGNQITPAVFLQEHEAKERHQIMQGIEDLRLFRHTDGVTYFNASYYDATTRFTSTICGRYPTDDMTTYALDRTIIRPTFTPSEPKVMEKNWAYFTDAQDQLAMVHSWSPLKIGRIDWDKQTLDLVATKETPPFFAGARGSTPGALFMNNGQAEWWFVLHKQDHFKNKEGINYFRYHHFFAVFDRHMNCLRYSELFQFEGAPVEYCLSLSQQQQQLLISYSVLDQQPKIGVYSLQHIQTAIKWTDVPTTVERHNDNYFANSPYKHHIGVYNPFPRHRNAEYELLQRFEMACQKIGVGFLLLHNDNVIYNKQHPLSGIHVDTIDTKHISFLLSLHADSPKTSKHFTLITVWNPIAFHDKKKWQRTFSADGYLSAYSDNIDNYIRANQEKPFYGHMNPTLSGPLLDFTFGRYHCFYIGINWEKKHNYITFNREQILKLVYAMDKQNMISLYGLSDSWNNCRNYVGEIAFDGVSVVHEIHRCGICLVLSSESHMQDAVVSMRLFEGLAAGVPIISDRNPFIVNWFGDNVFYIDDHGDTDRSIQQIRQHIAFIQQEPETTLDKMKKCREIFTAHFLLDQQLLRVIDNIKSR